MQQIIWKTKVIKTQGHDFWIISLDFAIINALVVIYFYSIWVVETLWDGVLLCIFLSFMFIGVTLGHGGSIYPKEIDWQTRKPGLFLSPESQFSNPYYHTPGYLSGACCTLAPRVPQWESAPVTHIHCVPSCPSLNCLFYLLVIPEITSRISLCLRAVFGISPN